MKAPLQGMGGKESLIGSLRTYLPLRPLLVGFITVAVAGGILWSFQTAARPLSFDSIRTALHAVPSSKILASLAATLVSYVALFGYDLSGLRYARARPSISITAVASFCGYAIGNAVGLGMFTGGAVRYRIYTAAGLTPGQVARVILFISAGFGFGIGLTACLGALLAADSVSGILHVSAAMLRAVSITVLALVSIFVAACLAQQRMLRWGAFEFDIPSAKLVIAQFALAVIDVLAASTALWVLLPSGSVDFATFTAVFAAALGLGVLSHAPGGLGIFELVILFSLGGKAEGGAVAAALVIYRVIYFILPLLMATALLAVFEARRAVGASILTGIERAESNLTPLFLAAMTFIIGAVLVVSGGMPALTTRLQILQLHVPLWAVEASHLLASVAGLTLLFSARGLVHRLDGAWWLALSIMLLSVPFSLVKGLAVVAPSATLILVVGLLMSRRQFNRRASLFAPLTAGWLTAIVFVLVAMAWILFFAFRDIEYVNELWWQFAFDATAPRALRAVLGVAVFSLAVGLWQLLRPAPGDLHPPTLSDLDRAGGIVAQQPRADALLALMGDKNFLFSESGRSFLMFSKWRRTWVALGDPVGEANEYADLIWRFIELANAHGGRAAFYQVPPTSLPLYLDVGLNVLKVGEEGIISLRDFNLVGARRAGLRYALGRGERDGLDFEFVPSDRTPGFLKVIEQISSAWLTAHHAGEEKQFSVAAFDRFFVSAQSLGIVRQRGKPVAFVTIMTTRLKDTATVGLMRYRPDTLSRYVMEFLFVRLLLALKEQGYRRFSLGVAPLSGLRRHSLANSWHHIASFIWSIGQRLYSFQGLRLFKEKFGPLWEPRYIATSGPLGAYLALFDISSLVAGAARATPRRNAPKRRWRVQALMSIGLAAALCLLAPAPAAAGVDTGNFGNIHILRPPGQVRNVVVLLSDRQGWAATANEIASALSRGGSLVVGIDLPLYLERLQQKSNGTCHRAVGDIDFVIPQVEREYGLQSYLPPVVAGLGEGGTLAGSILAQAPPLTVAAAVALNPAAQIATSVPMCTAGSSEDSRSDKSLSTKRWVAGFTRTADSADRHQVEQLRASGAPVEIVSIASEQSLADGMTGLVRSVLPERTDDLVSRLPLVELPAAHPRGLAIILSGDGGWRDLDKTIGEQLSSEGISVVGWDCLRYFWRHKSPQQTAHDLSAVIDAYTARWHVTRVALIGYSFGADVLPIVYGRLAPEARARVVQMSLLAPGRAADFEISMAGWLGAPATKDAIPTTPALASINASMIQCFYGDEEQDSACPTLESTGAAIVKTSGGHHFDGNYNALALDILHRFERTTNG